MSFPIDKIPSMDLSLFQCENDWNGPFSFVCGADSTVVSWEKEIQLTKESIQRINAMNPLPKFYVICGDMLDAFPYEGKDKRETRAEQYKDFVNVFKDLSPCVKLVCVCGNHDIGDIPTNETLAIYKNQFGPDFFSFWVGGVKFVVLNSQYFEAPDALPDETKKHLEFMEGIGDPNAKHVGEKMLSFDEEKEYFNLGKDFRIKMLDTMRNAGVKYVFCGHYHRNAGGFYKDLELIVTSALGCPLGSDPSGFRVVNVKENNITHEYIPFRQSSDVSEI